LHTTGAKLPSSSDVYELLEYLVEKKLKYELDGISTTRLMLYHRAEDGKLQEWKDYSTNLKELQRHTQSNGVNPLCIVKPLRRSKELQFPISVILNLHMDSKWLEELHLLHFSTFQTVLRREACLLPLDTELSINLLTDEDVEDNFRRIWASGEQILRLRIETRESYGRVVVMCFVFSSPSHIQSRNHFQNGNSHIMALYNLSEDSYQALETFQCGINEISDEVRPTFNYLVEEIQASIKPSEQSKDHLRPTSQNSSAEFCLVLLLCLMADLSFILKWKWPAKKSDLKQGVAQNIMQLRSSDDSNKSKNLDRKEIPSTLFGMVTTAKKWVLIKVEKNGGEHKLYVDERAPYILDLRKNVSRRKLAAGLEELFKRLLWIYEQSLPDNKGRRIKTL
ncbi:hypothetical protein SeLEV6574_g08413, partial [Synchytrium endobioticum]